MLGMGPTEIIVILVLALLIFGPKRLPEIAQSIGKGIGELKRASKGIQDTVQKDIMQPLKDANPADISFTVNSPQAEEDADNS